MQTIYYFILECCVVELLFTPSFGDKLILHPGLDPGSPCYRHCWGLRVKPTMTKWGVDSSKYSYSYGRYFSFTIVLNAIPLYNLT